MASMLRPGISYVISASSSMKLVKPRPVNALTFSQTLPGEVHVSVHPSHQVDGSHGQLFATAWAQEAIPATAEEPSLLVDGFGGKLA